MQYNGEPPTLSMFLCQPFYALILNKPAFGRPYVRALDFRMTSAQLYAIGAALGHALRSKFNILDILLSVPNSDEHERNMIRDLCKKDANQNLEEFKGEFGQEPSTFVDFAFYKWLDRALGLTPREAFEAFLAGDRKAKRLFGEKIEAEGIGKSLIIMLLQGIQFGSFFPELTERMYDYHHKHYKDYWGNVWDGLAMPGELRAKSLEETEGTFLCLVAQYTQKYYPELVEPLGISDVLQNHS